jgi:hypothetical protein
MHSTSILGQTVLDLQQQAPKHNLSMLNHHLEILEALRRTLNPKDSRPERMGSL